MPHPRKRSISIKHSKAKQSSRVPATIKTLKSEWSQSEASRLIDAYGERWGEDLALRTYASRLIGKEQSLVLHGGGNTSVKGTITEADGTANSFKEGDAFFVPKGTVCSWKTNAHVKKFYCILDPDAG